jgi:hypothetical protein
MFIVFFLIVIVLYSVFPFLSQNAIDNNIAPGILTAGGFVEITFTPHA